MDKDILIIGYEPSASFIKGICALDLMTGKYNWCRPEDYGSLMAIDHQSQLGYAMRSGSVLSTIDLQTGNVLGETSFLSNEPETDNLVLLLFTSAMGSWMFILVIASKLLD